MAFTSRLKNRCRRWRKSMLLTPKSEISSGCFDRSRWKRREKLPDESLTLTSISLLLTRNFLLTRTAMMILLHMLPAFLMQNRKRKKNSSSFVRHRNKHKRIVLPGKKNFLWNAPSKNSRKWSVPSCSQCRAMNGKLCWKNKMSRWMISGTLLQFRIRKMSQSPLLIWTI